MNPCYHALDKSLRSLDVDGHMRVELSRISKANVCPYRGSEIPEHQALGLDPEKTYRLYRDPEELAKAASTFDGKPLLIKHVPVTAELPNQSLWVGTIGACTFEPPYLITRPLTVITAEAQALIESEEQRELSAGYRYRADMTPGASPEGESYDGVMRDIQGNHVAIVREGRAGPDVHVADEFPAELLDMSRRSTLVKNMFERLKSKGLLTADATLLAFDAGLGEVPAKSVVCLDESEKKAAVDAALDAKRKEYGEDAELTDEEREEALEKARDKKAKDAKRAKDKKAKDESEEDAEDESEEEAEDESEEEEEEAEDESEEEEAKDKRKRAKDAKSDEKDHRRDFRSGDKKGRDSKHGKDSALTMDEVNKIVAKAVSRAQTETEERVTSKQRAIAIAVDEVTALVGKVQIHAFDSAEEVYAFALDKVGVEVEDDFPEAGLRALVKNELRHRETSRKTPKHAQDATPKDYDFDNIMQRVEH